MHTPPQQSTRLVVVGTSAVGKSSFAKRLSSAWSIPRIELDAMYWGPNWTPKPKAEFLALIDEAVATQAWVADGNYGSVRGAIWPKATHVVWLNYSLPVNLWRGLKRTIHRCITRQELWHGNRESLTRSFMSRESILVWILTTHGRRRRELQALRDSAEFAHLTWHEFRHPGEAESWLRTAENAA